MPLEASPHWPAHFARPARTWAAYRAPRIVEFVESLPKSGTGKIMWRELQEPEAAKPARTES